MIHRGSNPNSPTGRTAGSGIPGEVHVIAEGTARVGIGCNHGLVVEVILARLEAEEVYAGISLAAIGRARNRHLRAVDPPNTEENHDVPIKHVAAGVESQGRIRTEIHSISAYRRRQRYVHAAPTASAIGGKIATHGQAENFIGAPRQNPGMAGIECDISLSL